MRDLTQNEIKVLWKSGCLFCHSEEDFTAGPQGGMMTNYKCEKCGAKYNLPPDPRFGFGQLIKGPDDE